MKHFIFLSALVFAAYAMPTELGNTFTDASALISNGTHRVPQGQAGFATLNNGTTGGAGGAVWTVWDAWALRDAVTGNERRIIYVRGRIDLTALFTGSPGVRLSVGNDKTIIGGDTNAMIFGGGLRMQNALNVIIQNIKFHNALNYAPGEQPDGNGGISNLVSGDFSQMDTVEIRTSTNVWIDHCEFADDPWDANSSPRRHDGLIDIVRGANWVSISNTIFRNHNLVTLIGNDDSGVGDQDQLKTTFSLNWWQGTNQRNPRVRWGEVHIVNNLYTDISEYAVGAGTAASIYIEKNVFVNTRRAWGFPAGTPNPISAVFDFENLLDNSTFDSGIPTNVDWVPSDYYTYNAMEASFVSDYVRLNAGTL